MQPVTVTVTNPTATIRLCDSAHTWDTSAQDADRGLRIKVLIANYARREHGPWTDSTLKGEGSTKHDGALFEALFQALGDGKQKEVMPIVNRPDFHEPANRPG